MERSNERLLTEFNGSLNFQFKQFWFDINLDLSFMLARNPYFVRLLHRPCFQFPPPLASDQQLWPQVHHKVSSINNRRQHWFVTCANLVSKRSSYLELMVTILSLGIMRIDLMVSRTKMLNIVTYLWNWFFITVQGTMQIWNWFYGAKLCPLNNTFKKHLYHYGRLPLMWYLFYKYKWLCDVGVEPGFKYGKKEAGTVDLNLQVFYSIRKMRF